MRTATARRVTSLLLATVFLAGCADEPEDDGNPVPYTYLGSAYRLSGTDYVDAVDLPSSVADEIHGHSSATERLDSEDKVFLRYRDDIVAISPFLTGSRIEVADYRTGYRRWKPHLRSWPDPDGAGFRGGGPGSGK